MQRLKYLRRRTLESFATEEEIYIPSLPPQILENEYVQPAIEAKLPTLAPEVTIPSLSVEAHVPMKSVEVPESLPVYTLEENPVHSEIVRQFLELVKNDSYNALPHAEKPVADVPRVDVAHEKVAMIYDETPTTDVPEIQSVDITEEPSELPHSERLTENETVQHYFDNGTGETKPQQSVTNSPEQMKETMVVEENQTPEIYVSQNTALKTVVERRTTVENISVNSGTIKPTETSIELPSFNTEWNIGETRLARDEVMRKSFDGEPHMHVEVERLPHHEPRSLNSILRGLVPQTKRVSTRAQKLNGIIMEHI
jgi:hypothetical protein